MARRARFSLRTLFAVFTVATLSLGFFFNRIQNERRAAEAIAAASGTIVYDWQIRPAGANPQAELKPPGPAWLHRHLGPHWFGQISEVEINGSAKSSKRSDLETLGPHLARLPALRSLSLWGGDLDIEDCAMLGSLTRVENLSLCPDSVISPQQAAAIARARGLKSLKLRHAKISAAAISELAAIPGLRDLVITCDSHDPLTGNSLEEYYLSDEGVRAIAGFPALRSVMLFHTEITDSGMRALCELSRLETLVVSSPHITGATFSHIRQLSHLTHLGTWAWNITDADLGKIRHMPNLISLDLQTNLTNEAVTELVKFKRLEKLTLRGGEVTEESVRRLRTMHKLTWLNLSDTNIPKESEAAALLKRSLPGCQIMLPKTEREKEIERQFHQWRWRARS